MKQGNAKIDLYKIDYKDHETAETKCSSLITKNVNGSEIKLILEGRLDTTTAPNLEAELKSSLDGITELIFDFSNLDYISSAGLRVLLTAQKIMNKQGQMKIVGANEIVLEVFDITGFSDILTVE